MTERDRKFGQKMAHKMCRFFVLEKSTLIYERHRDKGWAPVAGVSEMETRVVGIPRVAPPVPASGCCGVSDPPCVHVCMPRRSSIARLLASPTDFRVAFGKRTWKYHHRNRCVHFAHHTCTILQLSVSPLRAPTDHHHQGASDHHFYRAFLGETPCRPKTNRRRQSQG